MILKKLSIENIRSYEKQEINFPTGSTLLSGDIGSGKTSILLAIEFALFGLQPSQKGGSLLKSNAEQGKVILELEIDGKEIIIERTLKRGNKSISQDYSSVTINSEKFEGSVTEIKSKLLNLLNYPPEFAKKTNLLYKFTVYTPQEEMKQIILEPKDTRLNTLRHVFGIDKYKKIQENVSIFASKLREKIRINQGILYDLDDDVEKLKQKKDNLANLKKQLEEANSKHEDSVKALEEKQKLSDVVQEKINQKKSFENEKSKSEMLILEKKQQIASFEKNIETLNLQIQEAKKISFNEAEYNALNQRINFQESKESELQKEYTEIIGKINSIESKKSEAEQLKNKISHLQKCPTCLQEVGEEYKNNILANANSEIEAVAKISDELSIKKNNLIEQINTTKKSREEFVKRKSELELLKVRLEGVKEKQQRIAELNNQKNSVRKDSEMLAKQVITLENSIQEFSVYDRIFEERNKDLEKAKQECNNCAIRKAEINKEIQFSENEIKEKEEKIKEKKELKKKTEKIKEIENWVSDKFLNLVLVTEKNVMITLKDEFSKLFSKWFSTLVSENLSARLDDNFSPIIEQQDYELDYSFLSGGERTAIALAYRLSLNQVINSILSKIKTRNLVILDEPTDGFSDQQLDKIRDVLNQLNTEQLIIVSHEQKIEGFVDNIIRVRKESGVTRVEE